MTTSAHRDTISASEVFSPEKSHENSHRQDCVGHMAIWEHGHMGICQSHRFLAEKRGRPHDHAANTGDVKSVEGDGQILLVSEPKFGHVSATGYPV
jgi:hypothetical protein